MSNPAYQLPWVKEAGKFIGTKEIPGKQHARAILNFWRIIGRPYYTDEVAWCSGFVCAMFELAGFKSPKTESARNWLGWKDGVRLQYPVPGCVVVFWRGKKSGWAGHVGIVTRITKEGHLVVLGGNQDDMVKESIFGTDRVLGYMWPKDYPIPGDELEIVEDDAFAASKSEA